MRQFKKYEEFQNMLLTIEEEKDIKDVINFIAENELLTDDKNAISTLNLISSVAYSRCNLYDKIVLLLKQIPKNNCILDQLNYLSDRDGSYIFYNLCNLLIDSNHISNDFHNDNPYYISWKIETNNNKELYKIIQNDDAEALQDIITKNDIGLDNIYTFKTFKDITLLECSALMGSINCFKYLWMITKTRNFDELLKCSIAGGNFDIIHIIENEMDFDMPKNPKILYKAILYMQNDLIEYIVNVYNIDIDADSYIKCIFASNYIALKKLIEIDPSRSINTYGKNGSTPLHIASFQGKSIFFEYLYFLDNNSIFILNRRGRNVLQYAIINCQFNIIEFIINRNLINPYEHDFDYDDDSPFVIAVMFFKKETIDHLNYILHYAINDKKIDFDINEYYSMEDEKYYIDKKSWLAKKYDHDKTKKHYSINKKGNKTKHKIKYSLKKIYPDL